MAQKIIGGNGYTSWGWPSTVVGDPATALRDGDDATYLTSGEGNEGWLGSGSMIHLEPLTGYETGDPISLALRFSFRGGSTDTMPERISLVAAVDDFSTQVAHFGDSSSQSFFVDPPYDGTVQTLIQALSLAGLTTTTADVVAALQAGAFLRLDMFRHQSYVTSPEVRIHEAALHVGITPTSIHAPPQRLYPREDSLRGGAPRIYPPPRTRQSGNRIVGGYL